MPAWLSLILVVLVLAPLFGCALDKVIMRGLADATEATKLAVTIGVLVALVGAALWIWDPNKSRPFPAFYTGHKVKILGTFVTADQLITIGLGLVVAVGLRILLYRTRIGLDMRAVVDDRSLVLLNGGRPDRASMSSWAVGSSLAVAGRHPDRALPAAVGRAADPARRQRLRGGRHRQAAQPAADHRRAR